jgi:predicted phosphodiesterase
MNRILVIQILDGRVRLLLMLAVFCLAACNASPAAEESSLTPVDLVVGSGPAVTAVLGPAATLHQSTLPATLAATLTPLQPTASFTPLPSPSAVPSATSTPQPQRITFAVIGDYGTAGQGTQDVAALVHSWDPDFVITLGDNNYPDGAYETIEANIMQHYGRFAEEKRFFPVLGNHDMTTENGRPYLEAFDLPGNERYYDYVRGDVHFFALNSDWREPDGIASGSRQAAWLQEKLTASMTTWQVVYLHSPPYVSMEAKMVPVSRWPFAAWGADLVLSGHAHLYERLQIDGIPYVVNGLGGGGIYPFDEQPLLGSQVRFNDNYGALLLEVTAERLLLRFITREGSVVDHLTLSSLE